MRLLFTIDKKDYDPQGEAFVRHSARAIIIQNDRVAMVHSRKYDYYKFPGGGIEPGETALTAMIRETAEEAGLRVLPETVREYGYVHRVEKGDREPRFIQDNFYFLCQAAAERVPQMLEEYEKENGFHLEFVRPEQAVAANRASADGQKYSTMLLREAMVLEMLMDEGCFGKKL